MGACVTTECQVFTRFSSSGKEKFLAGVFDGEPAYPTAPTWSPICGAHWQCSASWWRTALDRDDLSKVCSGFWCFCPQSCFFSASERSGEVLCYVWVTCLSSVNALLSAAPQNTASNVEAEMWDAAWRDSLIEAKLWHGHHRRKRSRSKFSLPKSPARVTRTPLWDAQLQREKTPIYASN